MLEEAIAQKEVELKRVNTELEKTYVSVRAFAVSGYVFYAGAKCSGLLEKAEPLLKLGVRQPIAPTIAERTFAIDVGACLNDALEYKSSLKELRISDYEYLVKQIAELGPKLAKRREQAMREYENTAVRARANPDLLLPPTDLRVRGLELVAKLYADTNSARVSGPKLEPTVSFEQQKKNLAIEIEQERVALRYAEDIRNEIASLRALKWPNDK